MLKSSGYVTDRAGIWYSQSVFNSESPKMYDYLRRSNSRKFLQNQKASGSHEAQNIYIIWKSHQIFNKKKFSSTLLQSNLSLPTPLSCQKSYIPYFHNTDSSVKRKIGSVPLVSALKRFDCINFPAQPVGIPLIPELGVAESWSFWSAASLN